MLLACFIGPWEVLEIDIQDICKKSGAGNRHLLLVVGRASKFAFAFPPETREADGVAQK